MADFEHNFENRTFKLTLTTNGSNYNLSFEIYDEKNCYFYCSDLPFYKNRISELIEMFKNSNPWSEMKSFNFGHGNKSFVLFYTGVLIGNIKYEQTEFPSEFKVTGLSGEALSHYLQFALMGNNDELV